jgi:hypothetical protein
MNYVNAEEGVGASITKTEKGFVVCIVDVDADDGIIATRRFNLEDDAVTWAVKCVHGGTKVAEWRA